MAEDIEDGSFEESEGVEEVFVGEKEGALLVEESESEEG